MDNNLFGSIEGLKFLTEHSRTLKEQTSLLATKNNNCSSTEFSPWKCAMAADNTLQEISIPKVNSHRGELITDPHELCSIADYLNGCGSDTNCHIHVPTGEWPVMVDIRKSRPDAIAAFKEGRTLLSANDVLDYLYDEIIDHVVPLDREKPSGYDSELAYGTIFRTFPKGSNGILAGFQLAHGLGHNIGMSLFSVDKIFTSSASDNIFYEVRHDKRTAHHAFVSAVALTAMTILSNEIYGLDRNVFCHEHHVKGYSAHLPDSLDAAISSLDRQCSFTDFGRHTIDSMKMIASLEE